MTASPIQNNNWETFFSQAAFVGREEELSFLERELVSNKRRSLLITGMAGVGKTSLAFKFAAKNRHLFPAGVYHVNSFSQSSASISESVSTYVSNPTLPYLIILDDADRYFSADWNSNFEALLLSRPSAKVICISRTLPSSSHFECAIKVNGVRQQDAWEIIEKLGSQDLLRSTADFLFTQSAGNPASIKSIIEAVQARFLSPSDVIHLLNGTGKSYSSIIGLDGAPVKPGSETEKIIIEDFRYVSSELLTNLHRTPHLIHELPPFKFEEVIAEILYRIGYEVTLTPKTRDGGKDIYAAKKDHLGSFLYVVECKKYAPDRPIGVGLIRELTGVVHAERATAGILATTSYFTKDAEQFQKQMRHQISLKDFIGIQEWLTQATKRKI